MKTSLRLTSIAAALALTFALVPPPSAHAGGFFLTDRGVRPMGRGFAFVAGADDAGALWYNPAGIAGLEPQFFADFTLTFFRADYTRIDGGGNVLPTVSASPPPLPIPMLAYAGDFGMDDLTFGFGVLAPNAVLLDWPEEISVDGSTEPAPQRYSLITLDGSLLAHIVAAVAWQPAEGLSLGVSPQLIVGSFRAVTALSSCDRVLCTQPENPDFDGLAEITAPVIEPGLQIGAQYQTGIVRLGASILWWPWAIAGDATLRVRLPSAAMFEGARVDGDSARVEQDFPFIFRAGVELRPTERLRAELAFVFEGWSAQDAVEIVPNDIWIRDVLAIQDYQVGTLRIPRQMNDTISVRLGGEYVVGDAGALALRAGAMYETSSFDDAYLTPLTLDSDKLVLALGASYEVSRGIFVDATYGHVFLADRSVTNSAVPQPNPIRPPPEPSAPAPDAPVYVGNGDYSMEADVVGVGLRWSFGAGEASQSRGASAAL